MITLFEGKAYSKGSWIGYSKGIRLGDIEVGPVQRFPDAPRRVGGLLSASSGSHLDLTRFLFDIFAMRMPRWLSHP